MSIWITNAAEQFAEALHASAEAPALRWGPSVSTTFGDLERASNRFARLLLDRGVRKGDPVCLSLEKSALAYAGALGCLKAGAPYFFVDPANPPARTRTMAARCRPSLAIITPGTPADLFSCPVAMASPDARDDPMLEAFDDGPVPIPWRVDSGDPAYVMFTSGSTGEPKGVTISHDNLLHFMGWTRRQLGTRPSDVFTGVNPLFFDNSVFDLYASVFAGAALVPVTQALLRRPQQMLDHIDAAGCTVFFSVPSLLVYLQTLKLVDGTSFPSIRTIIFGGEGYPKPMLAKLFQAVGSRIELLNVYGPTECTCICSAYRISADDLRDTTGYAPLGRLIPGFSYVIAGESGAPVARGETGELCLGGPAVGLGYYNDAAQTGRSFVQNPAHDRFHDRVYRTGDLVREDASDGALYFIGRADSQIKHQGYRIELGEIEHALAAIDAVDEAAAVYLTSGAAGRIVGIVASRGELRPDDVKAQASRLLPAYMVPDRVIVTRGLPKNPNGKIDRPAIRAALEEGALR
jgi:D-alanine--poly(phosphoribitol) ligase subunit 1